MLKSHDCDARYSSGSGSGSGSLFVQCFFIVAPMVGDVRNVLRARARNSATPHIARCTCTMTLQGARAPVVII